MIRPLTPEQARDRIRALMPRHRERAEAWARLEEAVRTGDPELAARTGGARAGHLDHLVRAALPTVALLRPHLGLLVASVTARDPRLLVVPERAGEAAAQAAAASEALLAWAWARADATAAIRAAVEDAVLLGTGFVKVGWALRVRDSGEEPAAEDAVQQSGPLKGGVVELDEPWVGHVRPHDILAPETGTSWDDVRWIAQRLVLPVDELREVFGARAVRDLRTDREAAEAAYQVSDDEDPGLPADERATVWEVWDCRARRVITMQLDGPVLDNSDWPHAGRRHPFVAVRPLRTGNRLWGVPVAEALLPLQSALNRALRLELEALERAAATKLMVPDGLLSEDALDALASLDPLQVVPVQAQGPVSDQVSVVTPPPLPADVWAVEGRLEAAMRGVLGLSELHTGGLGPDRMAATTAAVVDGVTTLRTQEIQAEVERAIAGVGHRLLELAAEVVTTERAMSVLGDLGAHWDRLSDEAIRAGLHVRVEGGSTRAVNPATRANRGLQLVQTVIPVLSQLGLDPVPALRAALRDLGHDPDQLVRPAAAPEAGPPPEDLAPLVDQAAPQPEPVDLGALLDVEQLLGGEVEDTAGDLASGAAEAGGLAL